MSEEIVSPVSTQKVWSAANAKDRIAIVTTDAALDARIRHIFRRESYEFVTVPDFVACQNELTDTILSILDARSNGGEDVLRYVRKSIYWKDYGLCALIAPQQGEFPYCGSPYREFDFDGYLFEVYNDKRWREHIKLTIRFLREPAPESYRI